MGGRRSRWQGREDAGTSGSGRQRARRHRDWLRLRLQPRLRPRLESGPRDWGRARGARGACGHEGWLGRSVPAKNTRRPGRGVRAALWRSDFCSRISPGGALQLGASTRAPLKPGASLAPGPQSSHLRNGDTSLPPCSSASRGGGRGDRTNGQVQETLRSSSTPAEK